MSNRFVGHFHFRLPATETTTDNNNNYYDDDDYNHNDDDVETANDNYKRDDNHDVTHVSTIS